jgi:septal ring factor EnvC (AmiA/AmiB activator)
MVPVVVSEEIERELTAARAEIEGLNFALKQASSIYDAVTEQRDGLRSGIDYASDQLRTVTEQRDKEREIYQKLYSAELARSNHYKQQCDRLAEALEKAKPIVSRYPSGWDLSHDELDDADKEIDEALQSLTTNEL